MSSIVCITVIYFISLPLLHSLREFIALCHVYILLCLVTSNTIDVHTATCTFKLNDGDTFEEGLTRHLYSSDCVHRRCKATGCSRYGDINHVVIHRAIDEMTTSLAPFCSVLPVFDIDALVAAADNTAAGRSRVIRGVRSLLLGLGIVVPMWH